MIMTPEGKKELSCLIKNIGVLIKIRYFNFIEKRVKSSKKPFKIVKKTTRYGIIFKDGFEITNVDYSIWKSIKCDKIEEKRERVENYKLTF